MDCESFYSTLDEPYFFFNEFRFLLGEKKEVLLFPSLDSNYQGSEVYKKRMGLFAQLYRKTKKIFSRIYKTTN